LGFLRPPVEGLHDAIRIMIDSEVTIGGLLRRQAVEDAATGDVDGGDRRGILIRLRVFLAREREAQPVARRSHLEKLIEQ
jgi:hypothetical protein